MKRCGFCGRYFRGIEFVLDEEMETLKREIDKNGKQIELGYCPEANRECENVCICNLSGAEADIGHFEGCPALSPKPKE